MILRMRSHFVSMALLALLATGGGACAKPDAEPRSTAGDQAQQKEVYPEPRWPSYFKPPASIDELMPAARQLVRNKSGFLGVGMGVLQAGETVLIVPNVKSDPMVVEAVVRALTERKVAAQVKNTYEPLGLTREEVLRQHEQ